MIIVINLGFLCIGVKCEFKCVLEVYWFGESSV